VSFEFGQPTKHRQDQPPMRRGRVAQASCNERKVALAAPMAASVFNRSRVERASPSNRVTTTVSPVIQLDQQPRQLLAVCPRAADLFLKDPLATGRLKFRHLRRQRLALLTRA
jgi:hypothetical protein